MIIILLCHGYSYQIRVNIVNLLTDRHRHRSDVLLLLFQEAACRVMQLPLTWWQIARSALSGDV